MADKPGPKRHLDLEGSYNVRDVGGYLTTDGRRTRWRTYLRSDSLDRLPPSSQDALLEYGLRTIIDLRMSDAVQNLPNVFEGSTRVAYYNQNMLGDGELPQALESPEAGARARYVSAAYGIWVDHRRERICGTLATLATPGTLPALVHCAGGKDRTGIITALVLGVAGVAAQTIADDYALSGRYLFQRYLDGGEPTDAGTADYTWRDYQRDYCPPEAMLEVLAHLDGKYGGIEQYLLGGGVSEVQLDNLRNALVE